MLGLTPPSAITHLSDRNGVPALVVHVAPSYIPEMRPVDWFSALGAILLRHLLNTIEKQFKNKVTFFKYLWLYFIVKNNMTSRTNT